MSQTLILFTITIIYQISVNGAPQQPVLNYQKPYFIQPYYYNGYPQQPLPYQSGFGQHQPVYLGAYPLNGAIGLPRPRENQQQGDPYPNIKAEIIDVDPEYQRQLLGEVSTVDQGVNSAPIQYSNSEATYHHQQHHHRRPSPQYIVRTNSYATNYTNIPIQQSKPQITRNSYSTVINRHFVYDPSRPAQKPINLSFVNGIPVTESSGSEATSQDNREEVTTTTSSSVDESTTVANDVEENDQPEDDATDITTTEPATKNRNLSGRRFVDVPRYCPDGTQMAHNGLCLEPFRLPLKFSSNNTETSTTTTSENGVQEQQQSE